MVSPSYRSGFPASVVVPLLWQMLGGLMFLHHHRFIHRDIKPDNYLLESDEIGAPLKLVDFGFMCRIKRSEKLSRVVGTVSFLAPEVIGESYDQRADVWSLGVTAFLLCTQQLPF